MNNYQKYLVCRPLFAKFERENLIPVIRNTFSKIDNINNAKPLNFSNISKCQNDSLLMMFHHDKKLESLWNNPLKYLNKFKSCFAVLTPDFTVQSGMDEILIMMNTYKNRWLGCTWQQYGVNVIPTISWADSDTYDICFSGVEKDAIVAVSTLGCTKEKEKEVFVKGLKEFIKRKNPKLIIWFGKVFSNINANIFPIDYTESFGNDDSIKLFNYNRIIKVKDGDYYGW